jgi:DNA-binding CsgD family transcriptional regulator
VTRDQKVAQAQILAARGTSNADIARQLGVTPNAVWKWLHPTATRERNRRENAAPGRKEAKRAWENEHDRGRCPCGNQLVVGANRRGTRICAECWHETQRVGRAMRLQPVHEMWHAGASLREIAASMGTTEQTIGVQVSTMRLEGWDMPYRRPGPHTRVAA